ncbi:MAG: metallophosphoesterase [Opitutaceae bacterium]|jgi:hypothetical protein
MKLHVLSDLHLEFKDWVPPTTDADLVILAGDTQPKLAGLRWAIEQFRNKRVLYVVGNHEFYRERHPRLIEKMRALAAGSTVTIMENDSIEIDGWRFFGCTLWTDFKFFGDPVVGSAAVAEMMTDYKLIRCSPSTRCFSPEIARQLHLESKTKIEQFLVDGPARRSVVISHHAPSARSLPPFLAQDEINPAYVSNLDAFIGNHQPALWIHGHVHWHSDYLIGSTRVLANPRGYPEESRDSGFVPNLVIELQDTP